MDLEIEGRGALVTAASRGLGRATAAALATEGARVAITSRDEARVTAAAEQTGARAALTHDTGDLDAVPDLLAEAERCLEAPIDILVTNTGGPPLSADPLAATPDQWQAAYRNLVLAPLAFVEHALPGMRERGFGRIVNVSSTSVREPIDGLMLSNAHRTGALGAFKTIARQVARDNVTLNTVLAGRILTDRSMELAGSEAAAREAARDEVPAARPGTPEEFAAVVAFLCSSAAAYVTGAAIPVDGALLRSL